MGREKTARRRRQRRLHHHKTNAAAGSDAIPTYSELSTWDRVSSFHGEIAIVMVLAAIVIALVTAYDFMRVRQVLDHGIVSTAVVVGIDDTRRHRFDGTVVQFATRDGVVIRTKVGTSRWEGRPTMGETRQVIYDPADPAGTVVDAGKKLVHLTHVLGVAGVAVLVPLAILIWRRGPGLFTPSSSRRRRSADM
ncbi:DUF3592 domain-containing protein [Planotetraspora mira]|uniref:DUF3592 domain-containing protein n=1 Tax=Planotetraspora mira TaxID=58121 RepID=A0A8J3TQN7_9ACTN|nr:DUF3592 domain-containing protein [Planotetraspora mira]GII30429.1 hypothetical protein Pmi06nite_38710 [Planotetraspora mira]